MANAADLLEDLLEPLDDIEHQANLAAALAAIGLGRRDLQYLDAQLCEP
ncbi:MAG: hypothetical protein KKC99_01150 [Proteobacteria bacterium]|nr:hypothetical protein [Pseudomonadota bacterium]